MQAMPPMPPMQMEAHDPSMFEADTVETDYITFARLVTAVKATPGIDRAALKAADNLYYAYVVHARQASDSKAYSAFTADMAMIRYAQRRLLALTDRVNHAAR